MAPETPEPTGHIPLSSTINFLAVIVAEHRLSPHLAPRASIPRYTSLRCRPLSLLSTLPRKKKTASQCLSSHVDELGIEPKTLSNTTEVRDRGRHRRRRRRRDANDTLYQLSYTPHAAYFAARDRRESELRSCAREYWFDMDGKGREGGTLSIKE